MRRGILRAAGEVDQLAMLAGYGAGGSTPNKRVERLMTELEATRTSALPA
ncbi:hypothetical protein [Kitasatospora purpeofusca]